MQPSDGNSKPAPNGESSVPENLALEPVADEPREPVPSEPARSRSFHIDLDSFMSELGQAGVAPEDYVQHVARAVELNHQIEVQSLDLYERRLMILSRHRERDPDQIDKRRNNAARRILKYSLALFAVLALTSAAVSLVLTVWLRGALTSSLLAATILLSSCGSVAMAACASLASGESMSSSDFERLIDASSRGLVSVIEKVIGPVKQKLLGSGDKDKS